MDNTQHTTSGFSQPDWSTYIRSTLTTMENTEKSTITGDVTYPYQPPGTTVSYGTFPSIPKDNSFEEYLQELEQLTELYSVLTPPSPQGFERKEDKLLNLVRKRITDLIKDQMD